MLQAKNCKVDTALTKCTRSTTWPATIQKHRCVEILPWQGGQKCANLTHSTKFIVSSALTKGAVQCNNFNSLAFKKILD